MKKRYRLFATIAAMSLALGLLTYGVVAATTVNMTISSSISYTAVGVAFNLYARGDVLASKPTGTITHLTSSTDEVMTTVDVTDPDTASLTIPTKSFTFENHWVVYTFTIENIGSNVIENVFVSAISTSSNIIVTKDSPAGNIAEGAKQSFRVYFELDDPYQSITDSDNISVILTIGELLYEQTDAAYIQPESMEGFTSSTQGNTTTYTRGPETYVVTTTTSGSTTTTTHTFTNGSRVTTFTTEDINGTDVTLTALNVTGGQTAGSMGGYSYIDIVIPDYIAVIGDGSNAIVGSSSPYRLTLGSGVTAINTGAFAGQGVVEVVFTGDFFRTIQPAAFQGSILQQIYLPEGLVSIGPEAFADAQGLAYVYIPSTLTSIGPLAFQGTNLMQTVGVVWSAGTNWGIYDGLTTSSTQIYDVSGYLSDSRYFSSVVGLLANGASLGYVGYWLRY